MSDLKSFATITPDDAEAVGGKGLSLARMAGAGLPVPPGFCLTSSAHRRLRGQTPLSDPALISALREAYRALGEGVVAVRSSATAEDGAEVSFAGQQETFLGVEGESALVEAIGACWASLDSDRARAYRRKQGVPEDGLAMAVVIQRLIPAESAGVLFTVDPHDPHGTSMLIEGAWGLGESVVSGRVSPDRFRVSRDTGAILESHVSIKTMRATQKGQEDVPLEMQAKPCLNESQLLDLAALGRQVEAFYGDARDIEWAWDKGRFWLLQARPITTISAAEREKVRQEEISALRKLAEVGGTVWARFNLAEILPQPTPMTWAIVRSFMSGLGGFGLTYRDLGYAPDPSLDVQGVYDLVCGRPYCNLSREPRLYARGQPLRHDFATLKDAPHKALYPRARPDWTKAGWGYWLFGPLHVLRNLRHEMNLQRWTHSFADRLKQEILPRYAESMARVRAEPLAQNSDEQLLAAFDKEIQRTLSDFARDSLKATILAAVALGKLEYLLRRSLGPERTRSAMGELVMGVRPEPEVDVPTGIRDLAAGRLERAVFLERFGHRGPLEMELSRPRWAEEPALVDRLIQQGAGESTTHAEDPQTTWERIATEARLTGLHRKLLEPEHRAALDFLALREAGKHYLMQGYAQIRAILLEIDRRRGLHGGIFFLTPQELPRLIRGQDFTSTIAARKRRWTIVQGIEVPHVLFSDDLEAIGRPVVREPGQDTLQGVPLSAGSAEGPALVLETPDIDTLPSEPYVLVCPSTDPAWVPLFVHACALIMETGGVLSHGAIVAREFGLPAVAGIPGVHRQLRNGQRLRVDGASGRVDVGK